ncbi:PREDICTED: uncharacterized protein LOC105950347 [Erythranthe guttata]|uniref:uncharacterized protein LOC105950347 n=1 Tax=Erythranthe guttata TaxID=4155 RepID=UPI00064DFC31|nr:PREDICTED: uncharacterized protein LOC105950347 [Erythranthe guttata]|eukprot:XP_012829152.1 PREDICTED: uncharacterized protein LOC105950347 [Erythranthe guttata]
MHRNQGVLITFLSDSDSDDLEMLVEATEEEEAEREIQRTHRRGSVLGRCVINRDRGEDFRMHRPLFCRILSDVEVYDPNFVQTKDAVGIPGLSSLQKVIAAYRILAYGVPADFLDDHIRIGKSTSSDSLRHFVKAIVAIYAEKYLRAPNEDDLSQLLQVNEQRGFPGMLGSSLNDINVLERSHIFSALTNGRAPPVNFIVNGNNYHMSYYLADGIYPSWATFVKTISAPISLKANHFAQAQEAARKDVERAFGVLQARYNIVRGLARFWDEETLANIM